MMGTEEKNGQNLTMESTEMTPPVTVSMKKLVAGVGTMFAGVLQMLEALEPQAAKQLMDRVAQNAETDQASANDTVSCVRSNTDRHGGRYYKDHRPQGKAGPYEQ